jgi:hypothetical protein
MAGLDEFSDFPRELFGREVMYGQRIVSGY